MKVAVVGSGVSGLAATWLLNEYSGHQVHLYEADSRPGGHANTVRFVPPGKDEKDGIDVDSGFIVFNPSTYPNFINFLKLHPHIRILPTEMTFAVSRDQGKFEWAGSNLFSIFCQPWRLLDPNMWRLIYDVLRFNACARRLVLQSDKKEDNGTELSIGQYLDDEGYSQSFRDNYLIPMTAAIWSTPPDKCALDFPARTLIQFMNNHHLLQITGKPSWLTLEGGSRVYVNTILRGLPASQLHLSTPVKALSSSSTSDSQVLLTFADGRTEAFDHVILSCHSDTALAILREGGGATSEEERILSAFQWSRNEVILHSDVRLMPKSRLAWSCWNYITSSTLDAHGKRRANADQVSLTYGMNALQHIPESTYGPVLVTLNPPFAPDPATVQGRYRYDHPVLDAQALRAQRALPAIQNTRGVSYAGAYTKYGFHEDGFASGLCAALPLLSKTEQERKLPFEVEMDVDRTPRELWLLAAFFDLLEGSGVRALLGAVGAAVLGAVLGVLGARGRL